MGNLTTYPAPPGIEPSPDFSVRVNGTELFVYHCPFASFAYLSTDGPVDVEVWTTLPFERVKVRPLSKGITPGADGSTIRFHVTGPMHLSVELDDRLRQPLFLFINPPEQNPPRRDDPNVRYFEAGKVHDVGPIELTGGKTLYIEGGAVVRGPVIARDADNVTIRGRGVLWGAHHRQVKPERVRLLHLLGCTDLAVEGIIVWDSRTWTLMPCGCDRVSIRNVKIVNHSPSDDAVDLVGCRDVVVEDCFIRAKDDCIAVKALTGFHPRGGEPVRNLLIQNCTFWNADYGNALEIGYETRCDSMSDITFRNCDVIHCESERYSSGGVLTIHNGDRAVISNVLYEDIRVEDAQEKLIDFKIQYAQYSRDEQRGQVRGVTVRNVRVIDGPTPVSIIQGYDAEHMLEDLTFENIVIHGATARNPQECHMVTERSRCVRFLAPELTWEKPK